MRRAARNLLLASCLALTPWAQAAAQTVQGRVVERASGTAIIGVHVLLLDGGSGRVVRTGLTDLAGGFRLEAAVPGRYRVRAEIIGRQTVETRVFEVAGEPVAGLMIEMPVEPVSLAAIDVRGTRRCESVAGEELSRVWEEARKALSLEVTTRQHAGYQYRIERFERLLAPDGRRAVRESRRQFEHSAAESFRSRPADQLAARGFLEETDTAVYVYGPTADVLLDDTFLATHCFSLTRDRGRIGLEFRPLPDRQVTDIRGTLWIDQTSARLQTVEFTYVNLPAEARGTGYGGHAAFEHRPDGGVYVREWSIRSPIVETLIVRLFGRPTEQTQLTAIYEEGGRVLGAEAPDLASAVPPQPALARSSISRGRFRVGPLAAGNPRTGSAGAAAGTGAAADSVLDPQHARLHGRVLEAETGRPLAGVRLQLADADVSATSDESGRFLLADVPVGEHQLLARLPDGRQVQQPIAVEANGASDLVIRFPAQAVQLTGLDVTIRERARWLELQGFYDRRDRGGISGHFIDRELIERRLPNVITDLLYDVPGVRLIHIEPGRMTVMFNRIISMSPRNGCEPALYIDGSRYRSPGSGFAVDNWNPIPVAQLEAVEVYVGAAVPIQYNHPCGVVLLWTRRGRDPG